MDYCNAVEYCAAQQRRGARELTFGGDMRFVDMEYMRHRPRAVPNSENYKFLFILRAQMYNVLIVDRTDFVTTNAVKGKK